MSNEEKISLVRTMLGESGISESLVKAYLDSAKREILSWRFGKNKPDEVPEEYEMTQVQAVIVGYSMRGAESETWHSENNVARTFKYGDMLQYIHQNVVQMVGVVQ